MGLFSFLTQDTNTSIPCKGSSRKTFTVYLRLPNGKVYKEEEYKGYGIFGGKDYYKSLSECNPQHSCQEKDHRKRGLNIMYDKAEEGTLYPIFTELDVYDGDFAKPPMSCPDQGYFYDDSSSGEEEKEEVPFKKQKK